MTLIVLAMAGGALGVFCVLIARHYERLLCSGSIPDGDSLANAVRAAWCTPMFSIISVDAARRTNAVSRVIALLASLMLGGLYLRYGMSPTFACFGGAGLILLLLSCIDARVSLLPDALTQPLLWLGLICAWAGPGIDLESSLGGVVAGYGLLALPRWLWWRWRQQECIGAGDVKLLAALGAWVGAWAVVHVLMLACIAGAAFTVLHQRRWRPSGSYPFGPFMALAGMADFLSPSGLQSLFSI